MRRPRAISGATTVAILSIAVVVVLVSSLIAADGDVADWEREGLLFFNEWPDWLEPVFWLLQQPGVLLAPLIAGVVIAIRTHRWVYLLPFALVLPLKLLIEKAVVKELVERERPFVSIGPEIEVRGTAFDGLAFPSGHATTAFAMFILVSAFVPRRWSWLPLLAAVIVAVARLYYGEHNVLDVIAGAAMGTAFAVVLWFVLLNRWAEPVAEPTS